ncbi:MAG: ADP-dependent glucokinase/phosphofructokinase [Candidatus Nanohaloarchaea archaeon]
MKEIWRNRYSEMAERPEIGGFQVLTAFNTNIDRRINLEELDWELEDAEKLEEVKSIEEVKKTLKYAVENGKNMEVDASGLKTGIDGGKAAVGGQAGIMANFLSGLNGSVTLYTPLLSQKMADMIDDRVLHPYFESEFTLKNVRDSANTDRTKENIIIEFSRPQTGRLILSDKLRGFGPYFRSGIEDNLDKIDENIQGALLSGFQNVKGNREVKIEKAKRQISRFDSRKHLELVGADRKLFHLIGREVLPEVESVGMDETEALKLAEMSDESYGEPLHIGEAYNLMKELLEEAELERCHLHTYRYHLIVAEESYPVELEVLRDGMVFGEVAALLRADTGEIPSIEEFEGLDFEDKHVKNLDELEDFQEFFDLDNFVEEGKALVEDYKVCAVPTVIHEDPEVLVGMGDLISSGAFAYELSRGSGQ